MAPIMAEKIYSTLLSPVSGIESLTEACNAAEGQKVDIYTDSAYAHGVSYHGCDSPTVDNIATTTAKGH